MRHYLQKDQITEETERMEFDEVRASEWPDPIYLMYLGELVGVVNVAHLGNDPACGFRLYGLVRDALVAASRKR